MLFCIIDILFEWRQRVGSMAIFFQLLFLGIQLSLIFSEFILFQYAKPKHGRSLWWRDMETSNIFLQFSAAEICKETHVFPKLYLLTNHNRLVQDMQIIMLPAD